MLSKRSYIAVHHAIDSGRHAFMRLKEFAEVRKVRESQFVDNFFDGSPGMTEHVFYFPYGRFVYPLCRCFSARLLDDAAQVFGSDTQP